LQLEDPQKAIE
jgi:hypothetical protein